MSVRDYFPTKIYQSKLLLNSRLKNNLSTLNKELLKECYQIRDLDHQGRQWSRENYPGGFTSYSSMSELFRVSSTFDKLKKHIDRHVKKYAQSLNMDLKQHPLEMTNLWVNIVPRHTYHGLHLHPLSSISGTYYVQVPEKSGMIKFEDPRLPCFMASVPRITGASLQNLRFVSIKPQAGDVLLFESWLRHEVMQNLSSGDRVSISFNYNWF